MLLRASLTSTVCGDRALVTRRRLQERERGKKGLLILILSKYGSMSSSSILIYVFATFSPQPYRWVNRRHQCTAASHHHHQNNHSPALTPVLLLGTNASTLESLLSTAHIPVPIRRRLRAAPWSFAFARLLARGSSRTALAAPAAGWRCCCPKTSRPCKPFLHGERLGVCMRGRTFSFLQRGGLGVRVCASHSQHPCSCIPSSRRGSAHSSP